MNADGISSSDSASPLLHPADEFAMISGLSLNPQSADRGCVCSRSRSVYSGSSSPHSASPEIFDPAERLVGREHETSLMTSWFRNGGAGPDGTNRTASELPSEWKDLAHVCKTPAGQSAQSSISTEETRTETAGFILTKKTK